MKDSAKQVIRLAWLYQRRLAGPPARGGGHVIELCVAALSRIPLYMNDHHRSAGNDVNSLPDHKPSGASARQSDVKQERFFGSA